jgi:lipoprotein LpqH
VVCETNQGKFSIAVGDMLTGIIVGLEQDGSVVHNAGLGTVDGVVMSFTEGAPGNTATATKTGNAYKITGTATGVDNAGKEVSKPFEVNVTCP